MWAIISDIHGNLEALNAVLADIEAREVEGIICLGDIVGYGPRPVECIDLVRASCAITLKGNHDHACAKEDLQGYAVHVEQSIRWSRKVITEQEEIDHADRWGFLRSLPETWQDKSMLLVHGSPRNPMNGYVFPEDIYNQRKIEEIFAQIWRFCFVGHTHLPGVFVGPTYLDSTGMNPPAEDLNPMTEHASFYSPEDVDDVWQLDHHKTLINVGSVGQPRDGDSRACYVLLDKMTVYFRRVEYDIEEAIRQVSDNDDLDDFLGDRLRDGH